MLVGVGRRGGRARPLPNRGRRPYGGPSSGPAMPPAQTDDQRLGFLTGRFDLIDAARGTAIVAMIAYHFAWDLSYLRLIATPVAIHPVWRWYAHVIAGSFLFLVGVGLALAHGRGFRAHAFVRRLAIIGGAGLALTIATYFALPQAYIFF